MVTEEAKPDLHTDFSSPRLPNILKKTIHQLLLYLTLCEKSYAGRSKQNILATPLQANKDKELALSIYSTFMRSEKQKQFLLHNS